MIDLNPLDILDARKLDFLPNHFAKASIVESLFSDDTDLETWIRTHSTGRYAIERYPSSDKTESLRSIMFVGFEEEKELTYFMLACPYFRR